jgi:hypothetical protein
LFHVGAHQSRGRLRPSNETMRAALHLNLDAAVHAHGTYSHPVQSPTRLSDGSYSLSFRLELDPGRGPGGGAALTPDDDFRVCDAPGAVGIEARLLGSDTWFPVGDVPLAAWPVPVDARVCVACALPHATYPRFVATWSP